MMLSCPYCGDLRSHVIPRHQTVEQQRSGKFWRLRRCDQCQRLFYSSEMVEPIPLENLPPDGIAMR